MAARGVDQREPSRDRQHRAGRELIGRRRIDDARRALAPVVRIRAQAFRVHRHRHHVEIAGLHRGARAAIAGLLDPHGVAGVRHQLQAQRDRALRTLGHHDLLRVAAHAARHGQMPRDRFAQRGLAERIAVAEQRAPRVAQRAVDRMPPRIDREMRERGHARPEALEFVGADDAARADAAEPLRDHRRRGARARFGPARRPDHARAASIRLQEAFGDELLVDGRHRVAGDAERVGQRACAGQAAAGRHHAAEDRVAQAAQQLPLQRGRARRARQRRVELWGKVGRR